MNGTAKRVHFSEVYCSSELNKRFAINSVDSWSATLSRMTIAAATERHG